jgi:hypothetical protein
MPAGKYQICQENLIEKVRKELSQAAKQREKTLETSERAE